jgi:hypothetical protein
MQINANKVADEDWARILEILPEGWEAQAKILGALKFGRKFMTPEQLIRVLLLHFSDSDSMRTTVGKSAAGGLANISDVALFKRINKSGEWLRWLSEHLIDETPAPAILDSALQGRRLLSIDGSVMCEPSASTSTWRLHYALDIRSLACHAMELTRAKIGESLTRFSIEPGDVVISDRGFTNRRGVNHVLDHGGDVLTRMNLTNLPLQDDTGQALDLLPLLRTLQSGQCGEWPALMKGTNGPVTVRVCAYRKTEDQRLESVRKLKKESKKKVALQAATIEVAGYVVVLTTLSILDAVGILSLYRHRWQVELAFKRMKSLLGLGCLKKKHPEGAKAWLQGKLLVACLIERLIAMGVLFSLSSITTASRKPRPRCLWREMALMLNLLKNAINPCMSLFKNLKIWGEVTDSLSERTRRKRTSQAEALRAGQFG